MLDYFIYAIFCYICILLTIFFFIKQVNKDPMNWALSPIIYGVSWIAGSVVVIEYGFYITEQDAYSEFTGAGLRYLLYTFILIGGYVTYASTCAFFKTRQRGLRHTPYIMAWGMLLFALAIQALLFVNAVLSPNALFNSDINRWNFWDNARFPLLNYVAGDTGFPFCYLGGVLVDYFRRAKSSLGLRLASCGLLMHFIFLLCQGQKYNGFILFFIGVGIPLFVSHRVEIGSSLMKNKRQLLGIFCVITFLVFSVFYWFSKNWTDSKMAMGPLKNLAYRAFVLQGHVYWGADYYYYNKEIDNSTAWDVFLDNDGKAVATAMMLIGDPKLVAFYQDRGIRFATAHPSVMLLLIGPLGVALFQFATGFFAAWLARVFSRGLYHANVIVSFGALNSIVCLYGILMMSEVNLLLSIKFIVPFLAMIWTLIFARLTPLNAGVYPK